MKKSLASGVGVAAALMVVFGSGVASAVDEYKGMTYAKASYAIYQAGGNLSIVTREGSYLPTDECVVVGSRTRSGGSTVLLDLNCNDLSAMNGHPGNSAVTEQGKAIMQAKETATTLSADYEKAIAGGKTPACFTSDGSNRYCIKICTESKTCSAELNEALGL